MLKLCSKRFPDLKLIQGDFNKAKAFEKLGKYDFIFSTGAITEYSQLDISLPLIYKHLKKKGTLILIGINRNVVGKVMSKLWKFELRGKEKIISALKKTKFRKIEVVPVSWKLFPTSYVKFVVKARKA